MTSVILIDNYDSFTWNLYEYLCQEGAQVEVYRNDKITIAQIEEANPDILVISPGPGHPDRDAGISRDVIDHFKGRKPVFGICMGQQCIFSVFGGEVRYAGEIVHGKTSPIAHDGKGMFKDVPQGVAVTRYHSLAGTEVSLPDDLEVTAKTDGGIIMGVRHKKYIIEGVQFHPESILTEEGHLMMRNILKYRGGFWDKAEQVEVNHGEADNQAKGSILDKIYAQRQKDIKEQQCVPGFRFEDLQKDLELGIAPPLIDFYARLKQTQPKKALIAEIKRASPSKGPIDLQANAAAQALEYSQAGASAISALTEPHWFKGSLDDLRNARKVIASLSNRPAILRKEFIFSEYQILEARLAGADTVLLIVKMLDDGLLKQLYNYSVGLGMEPLVEVSSKSEFRRALVLNPKVVGVNNRDLHSFAVDLDTTSSLASFTPEGTLLIALSGITNGEDAKKYGDDVHGFLVGEALMRAASTKDFVDSILG